MRKSWSATLVALMIVVPAASHGGDKTQSTMVSPVKTALGSPTDLGTRTVGSAWTNGVSKGKLQVDTKCKVQIQLKGLTLPDSDQIPGTGDEVICIADAKACTPNDANPAESLNLNISTIFRGEVKKGAVNIKEDIGPNGQVTGCTPGAKVIDYEKRLVCYEPQSSYVPYQGLDCGGTPCTGLTIPFAKENGIVPSQWQQGVMIFVPGVGAQFVPHPTSPIIASGGVYFGN